MRIEFSSGIIIATINELVIRMDNQGITLSAEADLVQCYLDACVVAVRGNGLSWSIKLDNRQQVLDIASVLGCDVR